MNNKQIQINDTDRLLLSDAKDRIFLESVTTYQRAVMALSPDQTLDLINDLLQRMNTRIVIHKSMVPNYQALTVG